MNAIWSMIAVIFVAVILIILFDQEDTDEGFRVVVKEERGNYKIEE